MAKLARQLSIYDPTSRTERARTVTVEGPELLLDCLDRDRSYLDLQMLGEVADGSPNCRVSLEVTIDMIKAPQVLALMPLNGRTRRPSSSMLTLETTTSSSAE